MANNLRVLYSNLADTATITATTSATNFPTTNMQNDIKGMVWRATSAVSNNITLNWGSIVSCNSIVLPFTNLSSAATINISMYSGASGGGSLMYTSGTIPAMYYTMPTWDTTYTGVNAYSYGGGSTVRHYTPTTISNILSIVITLVDSGSASNYLEVSRILAGVYWTPEFNTDYGISVEYTDLSTHSRAQAGNIITDVQPNYKTMTFSLNYMNASDRNTLVQIVKLSGMRKSMYISLFPADTEPEKEYLYQIYGRLSSGATITHPMYSIYASSITLQEV